jgi:hypothetical protein
MPGVGDKMDQGAREIAGGPEAAEAGGLSRPGISAVAAVFDVSRETHTTSPAQ